MNGGTPGWFSTTIFPHSQHCLSYITVHLTDQQTSRKVIILYSVVGGTAFVFLIVLVAVCCIKRRNDRARRKASEAREVIGLDILDGNTTMKDRVTCMPVSSLTSKIAEMFDPTKLRQFSLDKIDYVCDLGEGQFGLVFKGMLLKANVHFWFMNNLQL